MQDIDAFFKETASSLSDPQKTQPTNDKEDKEDEIDNTKDTQLKKDDYIYDTHMGMYFCNSLQMYYDATHFVFFDHHRFRCYHYEGESWKDVSFNHLLRLLKVFNDGLKLCNDAQVYEILDRQAELFAKDSLVLRLLGDEDEVLEGDEGLEIRFGKDSSFEDKDKSPAVIVFGSSEECCVCINHDTVGDRHCEISWKSAYGDNLFFIRSLGAETIVNEDLVSNDHRVLQDGDIVHIGDMRFKIDFYKYVKKNEPKTEYVHIDNVMCPISANRMLRNKLSRRMKSVPVNYRDRSKERRANFGYVRDTKVEVNTEEISIMEEAFKDNTTKTRIYKHAQLRYEESLYSIQTKPIFTASQTTPIPDTNIGRKMLQKLGWEKDTGIGKNRDGIKVPLPTVHRKQYSGLQ